MEAKDINFLIYLIKVISRASLGQRSGTDLLMVWFKCYVLGSKCFNPKKQLQHLKYYYSVLHFQLKYKTLLKVVKKMMIICILLSRAGRYRLKEISWVAILYISIFFFCDIIEVSSKSIIAYYINLIQKTNKHQLQV